MFLQFCVLIIVTRRIVENSWCCGVFNQRKGKSAFFFFFSEPVIKCISYNLRFLPIFYSLIYIFSFFLEGFCSKEWIAEATSPWWMSFAFKWSSWIIQKTISQNWKVKEKVEQRQFWFYGNEISLNVCFIFLFWLEFETYISPKLW